MIHLTHSAIRPNILLLLTDQQRFDTIQALGSKFSARTPHMDSLVRSGISFNNAFCTAPVCSPSRSTLMTGLYPTTAGIPTNLDPAPPLRGGLLTVGKRMRAAGYQTAYHGKWHLGGDLHVHGFDVAEECSHDESTRLMASRFWKDRDWMNHDRPFFQVVSFLNPHDHYFYDPMEEVDGYQRPWKNSRRSPDGLPASARGKQVDWPESQWGSYIRYYEEQIERVDADIGETLHHLRCSGFFQNTWIIFASDHGDMAGEHDIPFKGPFLYEGVLRVPLVIVPRSSGSVDRNPRVHARMISKPGAGDQHCSLLDIVPTILDLAGAGIVPELPGRSLVPVLQSASAPDPHEYIFAEWNNPGIRTARSRAWKYILHETGEEELYHLANDPAEMNNLAKAAGSKETKTAMKASLNTHLKAIGDPFAVIQA